MRLKPLSFLINLLIFVTGISSSYANSINVNGLLISDFWIKPTIGNHKMTSGYLTIENTNDIDERLVSLTSEISKKTQIHDMVVQNDIMKMKNFEDGVVIRANSKVSFRPGSYHIMFMELKKPIIVKNKYQVTLEFKKSGSVIIEMPVLTKKFNNKIKKDHHH